MTLDTRILVVDDEEGLRYLLQRVLGKAGLSVVQAASGEEAVAMLRQGQRFDTIVSDLMMPGMSGLQLLHAVRQMDLEVPMIILTGNPTLEGAMAAMEQGGFRYLTKPIQNQQLVDAVRGAAAHRRLTVLRRKALEVCEAGGWLLENQEDLEQRFAIAVENLWVAYQPIVSWPAKQIFGYEAFARSSNADLPTPGKLFDAAERLGKVQELGARVRDAVAESAERAPADCWLFVKVHALDLTSDHLYDPTSALAQIAGRVVLEVTERGSLQRIDDLTARVRRLHEMGFQIAVDDVGASYSGLTSFNQLGPDIVKLDASLVRHVDDSSSKARLVQSMISVCKQELGIRVVCEGVETVGERDALERAGADLLQGYLFARPERGFNAASL